MLGVCSEEVKKIRLAHRIRTVGRVAVDERRLRHVHTKFDGYVEHLYVDYTGKLVRRGERLLSIYSPDLVATQQEYLLAHRGQARLAESAVRSAAQGSVDLHEAAQDLFAPDALTATCACVTVFASSTVAADHAVISSLAAAIGTGPTLSRLRIQGTRVNGALIEDALVYRLYRAGLS